MLAFMLITLASAESIPTLFLTTPLQSAPPGAVASTFHQGLPTDDLVLESLPSSYQARLASRDRVRARLPADSQPAFLLFNTLKRWPSGSTITVAFEGGDNDLRRDIATTARQWCASHADIAFDFGEDGQGGFRSWTRGDKQFAANVRISFSDAGYWSLVGTDCIDKVVVSPAMASMNFQRFDLSRPPDWAAVVLHEFGHALGCEHEHQSRNSSCEDVFRWDDDPGYSLTLFEGRAVNDTEGRRPGLYTVLGHAPNFWPPWQVDHNLRRLPATSMTDDGQFDPLSIMKYWFPPSMFRDTNNSCFTPVQNLVLSKLDLDRIARFYPPRNDRDVKARFEVFRAISESKEVPAPIREAVQGQSSIR